MQVRVGNNITISNPSPEVLTWCQTNLKLPNPDFTKKARMGFWVGNTPKHLYLYEMHGGDVVIPYGCLKAIAPLIKDAVVQSDFKPSVSIDYGEPIPLYPYQETAVKACVHDTASNVSKIAYADLPVAEQYYIRIEYVYGTGEQVVSMFDEADVNRYEGRGDNTVVYYSRSNWAKGANHAEHSLYK